MTKHTSRQITNVTDNLEGYGEHEKKKKLGVAEKDIMVHY